MTEENFRFMEQFFRPILFWVFFINLDLKHHGDIIQLDFKGHFGWYFTFGNFFFKNHEEIMKKWKTSQNLQKWPKMQCFGFQTWFAIIFITQVRQNVQKSYFWPFSDIFCDLECTAFEAQSTLYRQSEINFFCLNPLAGNSS